MDYYNVVSKRNLPEADAHQYYFITWTVGACFVYFGEILCFRWWIWVLLCLFLICL